MMLITYLYQTVYTQVSIMYSIQWNYWTYLYVIKKNSVKQCISKFLDLFENSVPSRSVSHEAVSHEVLLYSLFKESYDVECEYWLLLATLSTFKQFWHFALKLIFQYTARPRGTLPHEALTLMGHCFEMGPKILRYTVLHCYLQHIIKM